MGPQKKIRYAVPLLALAVAGTIAHGTALVIGVEGTSLQGVVENYVYNVAIVAAALVCLMRAALVRRDRVAWALIGAGAASAAAGDIYWTLELADLKRPPYPSIADALYLLYYPLVGAGVLAFARGRVDRIRLGLALDGAIAGLGAATLAAVLLGPALSDFAARDPWRALVNAGYPIGDLVLLACIAGAAVVIGWRREWLLLAAGVITLGAADVIYLYRDATTGYVEGTPLDTLWLASAAVIGLAAWQSRGGSTRDLSRAHGSALAGLLSLLAVGVLTVDHFERATDLAVWLAAGTLVIAIARLGLAFAENRALLRAARHEAITDPLTGLANRRHLMRDLERATQPAADAPEYLLLLFDLDGFKHYNDSFGHPAGDLLLRRMGSRLAAAVEGRGQAYRLGGDEFCVLAPLSEGVGDSVTARSSEALRERGEGFTITSSIGRALIPGEASDPSEALRLADRRLYADKGRSSRSFGNQARDLLLGVLRESRPQLGQHLEGVAELAVRLGQRVGLDAEELDVLGRAAELHDIGKMAIPDAILSRPGPLSADEWELVRSHTVIGERMLSVAPALVPVAALVRSSHERWDGKGYPDHLRGEEIAVGARIIALCDAFEAMTEDRPYRQAMDPADALEEIAANAGSQFDPTLAAILREELGRESAPTRHQDELDTTAAPA
jgi:two-component system cell cycle response regulator